MRKVKIVLFVLAGLILIYFGIRTYRNISVMDKLTELRTEHFVISYQGIYNDEAEELANNLEGSYKRIRVDLNDPDHEIIRVFIHPTQTDFSSKIWS